MPRHSQLDRLSAPLAQNMERVKGIEPSLSAWEADVLPLNYTRTFKICALSLHPDIIPAGDSFVNDIFFLP